MKNASQGLAIASLLSAILAMFGVVPLSILLFFLFCEIANWIGCKDFNYAIQIFYFSWIFSIALSVLAIILGIFAHRAAEKESTSRVIASVGIGIGLLVWPLILISGLLVWLGSLW